MCILMPVRQTWRESLNESLCCHCESYKGDCKTLRLCRWDLHPLTMTSEVFYRNLRLTADVLPLVVANSKLTF